MDDLGRIIRSQRLKKGLTLKQLSGKTGLSISFLSEIERGVAEPSMASLRKIRQAVGTSLLSFRDEKRREQDNGNLVLEDRNASGADKYISDAKVVRQGQRKKLAYPGRSGFYELLTPDLNRQLEVLRFQMDPGYDSGPETFSDPPGEKCLVILSGGMEFTVSGEAFQLNAGDSLSYPAHAPVSWFVNSDEPVDAILIITPPGF